MLPSETRALGRTTALLLAVSLLRWGCPEDGPVVDGPAGTDALPVLLDSTRGAVQEAEQRGMPLEEGETMDPNHASAIDLDRLPRIGPAMAERIVEARDEAPFRSVDDLLRVRGIGPATLERLRPYLRVASESRSR